MTSWMSKAMPMGVGAIISFQSQIVCLPSSASTAAIKIQIKLRIRIKFAKKIKIHAIPIIYLK